VISGVHHVAIGVSDLESMKDFYRDLLGFTQTYADIPLSEQGIMREVTRSSRTVFSGAILGQPAGGILVELIKMSEPTPRPIRRDFRYGDIGLVKITVTTCDVDSAYERLRREVKICSVPKTVAIAGSGAYKFFYCRDPEGNLIEVASGRVGSSGPFEGVWTVGIGVTDMERSLLFYRDQLGFTNATGAHESFSGLVDEVSGTVGTRARSCLLLAGQTGTMVELIETLQPRGRSIPFSTVWGDFGLLQAAFKCDDIGTIVSDMRTAGLDLLCSPQVIAEGTLDPGQFVYVRDPDGIPIEFLFLP
jgi:catechol 2,3-dioxygenase-like lactoylglutathione lyase family enzyme